jgi:RimJ/RimL family protein N-acetyltransferase
VTTDGLDGGTGIRLRPLRDDDGERLLEMLHDPDQLRWGAPAFVGVPTDVAALAERIAESPQAWADGRPGTLAIVAADDALLGDISWRWSAAERMAVADLGYVVHPDARGRGVGRGAIALLTGWLLDPDGRGLARVQLDHSTENEASCRVALAAGFEREGVRRGFLPLRGPDGVVRRHDVCLHGRVVQPTG